MRFLTFSRQYPHWLFPGRGDRDEVSGSTVTVEAEPVLDGVNPLTWWRAARIVRTTAPDLLLVQWSVSYWGPMLWLLVRRPSSRTRTVMVCHNAAPHERPHPLAERLTRLVQWLVMRHVDHLVCHSDSDRVALEALVPEVRVHRVVMPTYEDLAMIRPASEGSSAGRPQLLFFGFVRPYKGVDVLLRAMPEVVAALPEARLVIAGEWWSSADGTRRLLTEEVRAHVEIRDRYVSNEEMAGLFRTADVVVLPYRSATQSAVVQLAFGFGVPVITTRVGGLPDIVSDERNGLLVPPEDPGALASAIVRYHREGWRARLAPAVAEARERFSWQSLVDTLERLVE